MNKTIQVQSEASSYKKYDPYLEFSKQNIQKQRKSRKSQATLGHAFPSIKVNTIRKQTGETEQQITLMKARIHALKQMKGKIQFKKQKSLEKIEFIHTVRERKNYESVQKLREKQKKDKQLDDLKQKAKELRQAMRTQIQKARNTIYMKNIHLVKHKKQMQSGFSLQLMEKQERQQEERQRKVDKIKEMERQHGYKLREFQQSRIKYAQQNHISRVEKQLQQKQKKQKSLRKLKEEAEKCIQQLKYSEKQYIQVLKCNPEVQAYGSASRISVFNKNSQQHMKEKKLNFNF